MFHVGQKVVYVGSKIPVGRPPHPNDPPKLILGHIYTIRDVDCRAVGLPEHPVPCILLEEVSAPRFETSVGIWEIGFMPHVFRPVIERKTDISIFTEMLAPKRMRELAVTQDKRANKGETL